MIPNKLVNSNYGPMIINGCDRFIGASIEQFGAWAPDDIELMKNIIYKLLENKNHVTFFDVGANIGTHSVALAKHFHNKISIRAFEAQRHVYYQLCGNVSLNGLDNVVCEHLAVSNGSLPHIEVAMPDYTQLNNFGGLELVPAKNSDNDQLIKGAAEQVKCTTIDSFHESVDFIKMDIEGMEYQALQGAKQTITLHQPICFVEVLKSDAGQILDYFTKQNYCGYRYKNEDWIFVHKQSLIKFDLPIVLK